MHARVKQAEDETQVTRREFVKSMKERLKEMEMESHREDEDILVRRRTSSLSRQTSFVAAREAAVRAKTKIAAMEPTPERSSP
jgi:hypothetical protein